MYPGSTAQARQFWSPCWLCGKRTYSHYEQLFTCSSGHDVVQWSKFDRYTPGTPPPDPATLSTHP